MKERENHLFWNEQQIHYARDPQRLQNLRINVRAEWRSSCIVCVLFFSMLDSRKTIKCKMRDGVYYCFLTGYESLKLNYVGRLQELSSYREVFISFSHQQVMYQSREREHDPANSISENLGRAVETSWLLKSLNLWTLFESSPYICLFFFCFRDCITLLSARLTFLWISVPNLRVNVVDSDVVRIHFSWDRIILLQIV